MKKRVITLSGADTIENPCHSARVLFIRGIGYAVVSFVSFMSLFLYACEGKQNNPAPQVSQVPQTEVAGADFSTTFFSVEEMTKKVMALVEKKDTAGLDALRVNEKEFKQYIWPEMPASGGSTECGRLCEYAWKDLNQKSDWHLKETLARYGGKTFTLLDIRFDGDTTEYKTFKIHRYARFLVRDETGKEKGIRLMGSVIEKDNRFKLLSYVIRD